jgi:hypothetical protein
VILLGAVAATWLALVAFCLALGRAAAMGDRHEPPPNGGGRSPVRAATLARVSSTKTLSTLALVALLTVGASTASAAATKLSEHDARAAVMRYEVRNTGGGDVFVGRCERYTATRLRCNVTLHDAAVACVQGSCVRLAAHWRAEVESVHGRLARVRDMNFMSMTNDNRP